MHFQQAPPPNAVYVQPHQQHVSMSTKHERNAQFLSLAQPPLSQMTNLPSYMLDSTPQQRNLNFDGPQLFQLQKQYQPDSHLIRVENSNLHPSNPPQLILDQPVPSETTRRTGGPFHGHKLSSLSDPISPITVAHQQQVGKHPSNLLNQTTDLTSSALNPTRAMINFLNNGQAVVASHTLSQGGGQEKEVNKTISDSNQIRAMANKKGADIKLEPNERKIGQYILGKSIGEGTFGKVKLGRHITTNEKVAVKILEKCKISDVADVERVSREIHILKIVQHPHLVQLYEIIETPKKLYLIMEFASGGELFDYIVKYQKVEEATACRFFQQIISGVEYISKLKIVHRDLKPENLLLDYDQGIKLVDFGLSNTYKQGELLKTACGSPCYAAPEMIAGKRYNGTMVDLWSCGVILFALLAGYLPFEDPNTSNLYKKILSADFEMPNFLSPEAQDLINRILTTDPDKRITIAQIKLHPWFNMQTQTLSKLPGTQVGFDPTPIDVNILKQLEEHNIDIDYARKCIEANKHNHVTATYYLILKKHIKAGGESVADARKPTYNPEVFLKRVPNLKNLLNIERERSKDRGTAKPSKAAKKQTIGHSPSLNFDCSSPGILSPSNRGSSLPPTKGNGRPRETKRRIAEGLGDFQRYSERKKDKKAMKKERAASSYVTRAHLNASDPTAQGYYDILSNQGAAEGKSNAHQQYFLTRDVSPCLSPVAPYGGNGAMILSHDNIPQMNNSILPMMDESSLQLGLQQQQSSKNATFGRQAKLTQKLRTSIEQPDHKQLMTLDVNKPMFSLNQVDTADTVDFMQGTSNFQTIGEPRTTKVRNSSLFNNLTTQERKQNLLSTEEFSKPIFRRRRDYSQGATTSTSKAKPSKGQSQQRKNRSQNQRKSARPNLSIQQPITLTQYPVGSTIDSSSVWYPQTVTGSMQPLQSLAYDTNPLANYPRNGLQDVRRQRVARKAGQNIGVEGNLTNTNQCMAAAYAPIMLVQNQNMVSPNQQQMQYLNNSHGGLVHFAGGPQPHMQVGVSRLNQTRASHQPNRSYLFEQQLNF